MRVVRGVLLACVALAACSRAGKMEQEEKKVESAGATQIEAQIAMDQGALELVSHYGEPVLDGLFAYNVPKWKPDVSYAVKSGTGQLSVKQGSSGGMVSGKTQNWWQLSLNTQLATQLQVDHKQGPTRLDLGS